MKKLLLFFAFAAFTTVSFSQSLIGSWQLVKQSTCIEENMPESDDDDHELLADMKSRDDKTPQVLRFKDNQNGDESTHILHTTKGSNKTNFLYKFDGTTLYILDKQSHTLVNTFNVESAPADSLILSNAARPCETKIFVKIK